jgi:hypothetical protein
MAAISAILGGTLGFFLALTGYFAFGLTALQALSLWSGTGIATLLALMFLAQFAPAATLVRA